MGARIHGTFSNCGNYTIRKIEPDPEKMLEAEREVARHLGKLKKAYQTGESDEQYMTNADERHFIINMDNGQCSGLCGDEEVKYADVTSGGEGMPMLVLLNGGPFSFISPP